MASAQAAQFVRATALQMQSQASENKRIILTQTFASSAAFVINSALLVPSLSIKL
jgi:hypothetical protein